MRSACRLVAACLVLAPAVSGAYAVLTTDAGYCGEARELRWARNPVPWYLSAAGTDDLPIDEVEAAAIAAFRVWEDVPGAWVRFEYRGRLDETSSVVADGARLAPDPVRYSPLRPARVLVSFQRANWPEALWGARGITFPLTYRCDGEIVFTDIVMNDTYTDWYVGDPIPACSSCFDLQGLLAHEVGHVLGLAHSDVPGATMTTCDEYVTSGCDCVRAGHTCAATLEADDAEGVSHLYPIAEAPPDSRMDRAVGEDCANAGDCAGEVCLHERGGSYCTGPCAEAADCPRGFVCDRPPGAATNPFGDSVCLLGGGGAGDDCAAGCRSGRCLPLPDDRCTEECSADGDCPDGWICDAGGWCAPASEPEPGPEPTDGGEADVSDDANDGRSADAGDVPGDSGDAGAGDGPTDGCACSVPAGAVPISPFALIAVFALRRLLRDPVRRANRRGPCRRGPSHG